MDSNRLFQDNLSDSDFEGFDNAEIEASARRVLSCISDISDSDEDPIFAETWSSDEHDSDTGGKSVIFKKKNADQNLHFSRNIQKI